MGVNDIHTIDVNYSGLGKKQLPSALQVNPSQSKSDFKVFEKFTEFLKKKKFSLKELHKRNKERSGLFKEASLLIFGDCSKKNVISLNRLYNNNYSLLKPLLSEEKPDNKDLRSGVIDDRSVDIAKVVLSTLGEDITKERFMDQEKFFFPKVYDTFCKENGWKSNSRSNKKKFVRAWNKLLTNLTLSDIGIKEVAEEAYKLEKEPKDEDCRDEEEGFQSSVGNTVYQSHIENENYVNFCTVRTTIDVWNAACEKDIDFENLMKEFISCYRRTGGVCTWTDYQDLFDNADSLRNLKSATNDVVIVFRKCMLDSCDNELRTYIKAESGEIIIEFKEQGQGGNCDVRDHDEYYERINYPFDRTEDILYRARLWMNVFGGCEDAIENPIEEKVEQTLPDEILTSSNNHTSIEQNYSDTRKQASIAKANSSTKLKVNFKNEEGTVTGNRDDVLENGKLNKGKFRIWLRNAVINQGKINCRLLFKHSYLISDNGHFKYVTYARCGSNKESKCKEFKFVTYVTDIVKVVITSRGPLSPNHKGKKRSYQLRGEEREMYKKLLKTDRAKTVQIVDTKMVNIDAALDLNMQSVRTLLTLRKCKSEAFQEDDLHSNDLIDLVLRAIGDSVSSTDETKYIRKLVVLPLEVIMFTGQQRKVVMSRSLPAAYFDATGSVARPIFLSNNKPILYYALVINVNGEIIPILEMLSEAHDVSTIVDLFITYKTFCLKSSRQQWPIVKRVVCDWSWAMMIGINVAWNTMDLLQYLRMCYNLVTGLGNPELYKDKVTIHACCAHFMKMISDRLAKESIQNKTVKRLLMGIMGLLVVCNSISEADEIYMILGTIALGEKKYSIVDDAITKIKNTIENKAPLLPEDELMHDVTIRIDDDEYVSGKTKIDSPFNKRCSLILSSVTNKLELSRGEESATEEVNIYYCPGFFEYVNNHLMPLLPFWSGLILFLHVDPNSELGNRLSNANVENYFGQVKHRILKSQTNLKVGRLIKLLESNVQSSLTNIKIEMAEYNKEKRKRNRKEIKPIESSNENIIIPVVNQEVEQETAFHSDDSEDVDDPGIEEHWQKRRKSSSTYLLTANKLLSTSKVIEENVICNIDCSQEESIKREIDECQVIGLDIGIDIDKELPHEIGIEPIVEERSLEKEEKNKFRVSLIKQYPHLCAMQNALFMNPDFYSYVEDGDQRDTHVVALFKNVSPTKNLYLFGDAYLTLFGLRELHQNILDSAIGALILKYGKTESVKFVNTETCYSLFREKSVTAASTVWNYFRNFSAVDKVVMPYLVQDKGHYCVLVGCIKERICSFYNPLPSYPDSNVIGFNKFRSFLNGLQKSQYSNEENRSDKWTYMTSKAAIQKDNFNCGIYVINYVESFLTDQEMPLEINPEGYREYIQKEVLRWSDNMADICLYCGRGETRCKVWVMCNSCKRWAHYQPCLKYLGKTQNEVDEEKFIFTCKLCEHYIMIHGKDPWE